MVRERREREREREESELPRALEILCNWIFPKSLSLMISPLVWGERTEERQKEREKRGKKKKEREKYTFLFHSLCDQGIFWQILNKRIVFQPFLKSSLKYLWNLK